MATDRNPEVMEMVEESLRDDPDYSAKDLKLKAEEIDEGIEDLSVRQFNARYPLQVRRKLSAEDGDSPGSRPADAGDGEESGEGSAEETKEKVLEMIEAALRENPDVSNDVLQERAAEIDPSIGELSSRSFHARDPLQVKRQMASERKEEEEGAKQQAAGDGLRAAVRRELLEFARDVAGAEDRGKVIDVLTGVDEYVDRVMEEA